MFHFDEQAMTSAESDEKHAWYTLKVARVVEETSDARSIELEVPAEHAAIFKYRAGQFVTLEVPLPTGAVRRCYSLCSSPQDDPGVYKVAVKRVTGGRASNWIVDRVRAGDTLRVLPPEGRFVLTMTERPLVLFAGGSGITPVISLLKTALVTSERKALLVYANRDGYSIIFNAELAAICRRFPDRVKVVHRLDDREGFVKEADVAKLIAGYEDGEPYLCGPAAFMDTVERGLVAAGVPADRIHVERFISLADPKPLENVPAPAAAESDEVSLAVTLRGVRHEVPYRAGQSILRAALDAGLDAPYSCEEGFCGTCCAQLLEGQVKMEADDALTSAEKKRGLVLACQSRPTTKKCAIQFVD